MFLGPAPKRPYNRNRFLYTFRQFWDYAGSMMADWGAHHMDIIHWAMGVDAPKSVTAVGGKFVMKDDRETPDTFMGDFEYPGFTARYTYRYTNGQPLFDRLVRHRLLRNARDSGRGPQQLRNLSGVCVLKPTTPLSRPP